MDARTILWVIAFAGVLTSACDSQMTAKDGSPLDTGGADSSSDDVKQTSLASSGELARRLTSLIWGDGNADDGSIEQLLGADPKPKNVLSVATKMLSDQRARKGIQAFFSWMLLLGDLKTWPKPAGLLDDDLRSSMMQEAPKFASHVMFDGDGRFKTLLTAPYTMMNERLAKHYGVTSFSSKDGEEFVPSPYPTEHGRAGLLSGAGVLTRFAGATEPTWPSRRHGLVSRIALCALPLPYSTAPPPLVTNPSDKGPVPAPARQRMWEATAAKGCQSCHAVINPVGYVFGRFDTVGRYQLSEGAEPIDDRAVIPGDWGGSVSLGGDISVTGVAELATYLADRPEVLRCFTLRWLHYIAGADPQWPVDAGTEKDPLLLSSLDSASAAFEASGGNMHALMEALVATPLFLSPRY